MVIWEFPKMRRPDIDPKILELLLYEDTQEIDTQFIKTAISL